MTTYNPALCSERLVPQARELAERQDVDIYIPARDCLGAMADQLEAVSLEILALKNANASLIPDAILAATDVECLAVERNAALAERNTLRDLVMEFLDADDAINDAANRRGVAHAALVAYRNTSKVP